ncbi:hypothetical protein D9758_002526 [Tetrapyrgos nigripes]|uniref:Uncharacterized protein n=1 Tax=Tetrapyrgos nigripes TaxID=182062 RepID=A0A8H5GQP0_9AGAR|nr:hypothetical protein D9758_002526 [Tetrapyrgos nigripes]
MFLDGKVLNVDVDEEWVELLDNGVVVQHRRHIRESHFQGALSECMQAFERVASMYEVDELEDFVGCAVSMNTFFSPKTRCSVHLPLRYIRKTSVRLFSDESASEKSSRERNRYVSTFNPVRFRREDFLDLSNLTKVTLQVAEDLKPTLSYVSVWHEGASKRIPFPPSTTGYVYYHISPDSPYAGGIRFRLVHIVDAEKNPLENFRNAQDLLATNGLPWTIPLYTLLYQEGYQQLVRRLAKTKMLTMETAQKCRELFQKHKTIHWNTNVLFSPEQIISVRRDVKYCKVLVVLEDGVYTESLFAPGILGQYQQEKRDGLEAGCVHARIFYDYNLDTFFSQVIRVQTQAGGPPLLVKADPTPLTRSTGGKPKWLLKLLEFHFLKSQRPDLLRSIEDLQLKEAE